VSTWTCSATGDYAAEEIEPSQYTSLPILDPAAVAAATAATSNRRALGKNLLAKQTSVYKVPIAGIAPVSDIRTPVSARNGI